MYDFFCGYVIGCFNSALTYLLILFLNDFRKKRKNSRTKKKEKFSPFDEEDDIF